MLVWMSVGFAGPTEGAVSPSVANATQGLIAPFFVAARTSSGQARWHATVSRRIAYGTRFRVLSFHLATRKDERRQR